jgi:hypothetical protein
MRICHIGRNSDIASGTEKRQFKPEESRMSARFALVVSVLGFAVWIMAPSDSRTQEAASSDQEGVQVEARGPVHEAFAEPAIRGPRATPMVPKEPPAPIEELPPDQKPEGDNVVWIPGYWAWDADRNDFLWVSGTYRAVPPGRSWVPGRWNQVDGGWQWVPGYWAEDTTQSQTEQAGSEVEYLPAPPDPVAEAPPPAPASTDVYVPGTWVYHDTRYMWRPGFYVPYRAGWVWIPAHYIWTPAGYVFVEGYWDFALSDRGLLFAPVYVRAGLYGRPGWFYQPSYTVPVPFLMGCLFVRADTCHYFFGDYFDAAYQRAGYVSWINFRVGQRFYDPLFEYYRFAHRDNPAWYRDLRAVYIGRQEGRIPRPPHNLLQQTTLVQNNRITTINNITVNNITNINSITNVAPLASLSQVQAARITKLQSLSRTQLQAERQAARDYRNVVTARAKVEQQVISRGSPLRTGVQAPVRMTIPVPAAIRRPSTAVKAPPPPTGLVSPRIEAGRAQPSGRATLPSGRAEERNVQPAERGRPVSPTPVQPSQEMRREPQPPATERRVPPVERPPTTIERRPETLPAERKPPAQAPQETRPRVSQTQRPPATVPETQERRAEPSPVERRPPTPPPAERRPPTPPPAAERRAPEPKPPAAERRPPPAEKKPPEKPKEKPPER